MNAAERAGSGPIPPIATDVIGRRRGILAAGTCLGQHSATPVERSQLAPFLGRRHATVHFDQNSFSIGGGVGHVEFSLDNGSGPSSTS
mgnify:CR=1 FL=1